MSEELTKSIKQWINKFDSPLEKQGYSDKEKELFKKGLIAGLQKGIELGQLAGERGIKCKLEF